MAETVETRGDERIIAALEQNWQAEMEGSATYRALAEREKDTHRKEVLLKLAEAETRHAERWERRLHELGAATPAYQGAPGGEANSLANRVGGPESALRRVEMGERKHIAEYSRQLTDLDDAPSAQILRDVIADERSHSKALKGLIASTPIGTRDARTQLDRLLKRESHRGGGRLHPHHPLLLHEWVRRRGGGRGHLADRPLCRRRGQVADHGALLVEQRPGDDRRGRP